MDDFNELIRTAAGYIWFILLAAGGGTLNYLSRVRRNQDLSFSIIEWFGELFASGFVGLITAYVCVYFEFPFPLTAAACGISGHLAGRILYMLDTKGGVLIDAAVDRVIGKKS